MMKPCKEGSLQDWQRGSWNGCTTLKFIRISFKGEYDEGERHCRLRKEIFL
jgi:hypothetical protein